MSVEHIADKTAELIAGGTILVASAGWVPIVFALPAAFFYLVKTWETETIKSLWLKSRAWLQSKLPRA